MTTSEPVARTDRAPAPGVDSHWYTVDRTSTCRR